MTKRRIFTGLFLFGAVCGFLTAPAMFPAAAPAKNSIVAPQTYGGPYVVFGEKAVVTIRSAPRLVVDADQHVRVAGPYVTGVMSTKINGIDIRVFADAVEEIQKTNE